MKIAKHTTSILIVLLWLLFVAGTTGSSPSISRRSVSPVLQLVSYGLVGYTQPGSSVHGAHAQRVAMAFASTALYAPASSASIASPTGQSPSAPQDDKVKRKGKPVMRTWDALRALPVSQPPLPRAVANLGVADNRTGIFVPGIYPSTRTLRAPPLS